MKKICFLLLIFCFVFCSCDRIVNPTECNVTIYNDCAWILYLGISGGDYSKDITVGKSSKKITIPTNVEYEVTISSPYDSSYYQ